MALMELRKVRKDYLLEKTRVPALRELSIDIQQGEVLCLMGPSGSGKTTLLNLLGGLDSPDQGSICLDGVDLARLNETDMATFRNKSLGFVFQSFNLIPVMSVHENVEYPLVLQGIPRPARKARVDTLLEAVGLGAFGRRSPEHLSGGQRQRVAIARALVHGPRLVLADEPTAALDRDTGQGVMELMVSMNRSLGTTLVISTHDPEVARHATRVIRLRDGAVA